jgi:hypothetical protein
MSIESGPGRTARRKWAIIMPAIFFMTRDEAVGRSSTRRGRASRDLPIRLGT